MKKIAMLLGLVALLPTAIATDFSLQINDAKGDVSDADIDIIKAWSSVEGSYIVFSMQVAGKINDTCYYWFTATNGSNEIGAVYWNGMAFYAGSVGGSFGQPEYEVNGNTLSLKIPAELFSSWKHFAFRAYAGKGYMEEGDFTEQAGDVENEANGDNNPAKEKPTDTSVKVEITNVKYNFEKNGNVVNVYIEIEGTTNGVNHVSLCYVIYYKDGTHDCQDWIKGPKKFDVEHGQYKMHLSFNKTDEQWKKWEFKMNGSYPESDYKWLNETKEKEIDKIVIYARAFKDAEEIKWNQCYKETKPTFSENTVSYGMGNSHEGGNNETKSKGKTPGFEFVVIACALAMAIAIKRRK